VSSADNATTTITRPDYEELIRFARILYAGAGIYRGVNEVKLIKRPGQEHEQFLLSAALKDTMRKSLWKFITSAGGFRRVEVLVGEEALSARIWDPYIAPDNPPTVTKISLEILADLYTWCRDEQPSRQPARIRSWRISEWGDALLLHMAMLEFLRHDYANFRKRWAPAMLARSPITAITHYAFPRPGRLNHEFMKKGDSHLYFWYLIDHIVAAWMRIEREKPRLPINKLTAILESQVKLFENIFELFAPSSADCESSAAQPHLLELFMRFYGRFLLENGGIEGTLSLINKMTEKLDSRKAVENLRRLWADVLMPGRWLEKMNQVISDKAANIQASPSENFFAKCYHAYAERYRESVSLIISALRDEIGGSA